jgi:hypothetical protein
MLVPELPRSISPSGARRPSRPAPTTISAELLERARGGAIVGPAPEARDAHLAVGQGAEHDRPVPDRLVARRPDRTGQR